jgi:hypothetical protein
MTLHVVPPSDPPPAPAVKKQRTITLTNRAPIRIVEDDWPVIAEGGCGEEQNPEYGFGWGISIRVRRHVDTGDRPKRQDFQDSYIIHGRYIYDSPHDEGNQTVRVGRVLTGNEGMRDLWKHISQIGDELRERIADEQHLKRVIHALDQCFANLSPHDLK